MTWGGKSVEQRYRTQGPPLRILFCKQKRMLGRDDNASRLEGLS